LASALRWIPRVESQVKPQNIDTRLSQKPELPSFGMLAHKLEQSILVNSTSPGNARDLKFRARRRDVRVKTGARRSHQIDGNRLAWIFRL
jgi:hypothetical protein